VTFGIAGFGYALGARLSVPETAPRYTNAYEKVVAGGIRYFHRADDSTGMTDLAAVAGARALAAAGLDADELDLVVLAAADVPEYLYWDASAATQAKLGAIRAEALLVNQACSSGVTGFDAAAGKFATHPGYRSALLITANRVCETYWNRMESSTAVTSDGAAAAVLLRGHTRYQWLGTEIRSDGRYADVGRLPGGGTACPVSSAHPDPGTVGNPAAEMTGFLGGGLRAKVRFLRMTAGLSRTVVDAVCARAGITADDVAFLLHMNGTEDMLADTAQRFGVPWKNTNAPFALEHGHFGAADQLLGLSLMDEDAAIPAGAHVALASTGNGMHWACTLLRA
jgi:3-oxoacyl-[acyl-carrier-protein] synthase-3